MVQEALILYEKSHYDEIFLDMQMPVHDGLAATRVIRAFEAAHPERPKAFVFARTARALKEEQQKTAEAGCATHLYKPTHRSELLQALSSIPVRPDCLELSAVPKPDSDIGEYC